MTRLRLVAALVGGALATSFACSVHAHAAATVPAGSTLTAVSRTWVATVSCPGSTMTGQPPPRPPARVRVPIVAHTAKRVRAYAFDGAFLLAPAGFRCEAGSGSSGSFITVYDPRAGSRPGESGPIWNVAMQLGYNWPGTLHTLYGSCGVFPQAKLELVRVAPANADFCDPPGRYPGERVAHSRNVERRTTPPRVKGFWHLSGGPNRTIGVQWFYLRPNLANRAQYMVCSLPTSFGRLCDDLIAAAGEGLRSGH